MHLYQPAETPQGARADIHRITGAEITKDAVYVMLTSYANATSQMPVWQDKLEMPVELFTTYPQSVIDWLTAASGPFPEAVVVEDETDIETLKRTRKKMVEHLRDTHIYSGVLTPSGFVDSDANSIRNIQGAHQLASLSKMTQQPFTMDWRLVDNTEVTLDADQMIAMGNAVLAHIQGCYAHSWNLKEQVDQATTEEDIEAITVGAGWPGQ